jgi:chorismate mutase
MIAAGAENNLSKEFITKILKAIHEESISHQHKIISE